MGVFKIIKILMAAVYNVIICKYLNILYLRRYQNYMTVNASTALTSHISSFSVFHRQKLLGKTSFNYTTVFVIQ